MNPIVWLVAGGILGWLTNVELGGHTPRDRMLNVAAGAVGALVAGGLLTWPFGFQTLSSSEFSVPAFFEAAFGAILVLALVNVPRLVRIP